MNPYLEKLHPYPFEKLNALKAGTTPPPIKHIALSIGEPKHAAPQFVRDTLADTLDKLSAYPSTKGLPALRATIADWLQSRFRLNRIDPETQILPVNGTREALFAFAQAAIDSTSGHHKPRVLMPNPFYQIYEGAALLAGAEPQYLNCTGDNGFVPDFDAVSADNWQRCQLLYLCSPGNPTGAVIDETTLGKLIELADKYDFIIASDECYSEIYFDESSPPPGLLQVCAATGRDDYRRCVVFHSLSKRSNLPGLRSGFVAGDAAIMGDFLRYRTYHGCAMSMPNQLASICAWADEEHVKANREQYRQKFAAFREVLNNTLPLRMPDAGFYFWADINRAGKGSDTEFTRALFEQQHITVLPGSFLGRDCGGINPGSGHIRMALVAPVEECREAALRIKTFIES